MSSSIGDRLIRPLGLVLAAAVTWAVASPAVAQLEKLGVSGGPAPNVKVSARILPPAAAQPARLSITAEIPEDWHIYSLTQRPGGPKRTRIVLVPSDDYKVSGLLTPAPAPAIKYYNDAWPRLPVEEHEEQVTWTAPLVLRSGVDPAKLVIRGRLQGQLCRDRCVEIDVPLEARLGGAAEGAGTDQTAARPGAVPVSAPRHGDSSPATNSRQPPLDGMPEIKSEFLTLSGYLDHRQVAPGGTANLTIVATPARGWHVYGLADREPTDILASRPTLVAVTDRGGLGVGPPVADRPLQEKPREEDPAHIDRYYAGPVRFMLPIQVPSGTPPGSYALSGAIGYMTCSDDGRLCDTPKGARFQVAVSVGQQSLAEQEPVRFTPAGYKEVAQAAASQPAWDRVAAVIPHKNDGELIVWTDLALNLVLAFVGGLLLNAMPCVLPVIGLKVMSFVQQAHEDRRRVLALNLWFTAGVVAVFLVIAALVAFLSLGGSAHFQNPEFRIVMTALTFVFALSLLGVWEIPMPGFVGSNTAHAIGEREGPMGALAKGVFSTLLATPCIGPLMGGTLEWTLHAGSVPLIFAIYGMMGLGMASPYLTIGVQPSLMRFVPKPGPWMETFKQLMGFVLLATVVWLFWVMPPRFVVPTIGLLFGLWLACWWIARTPLTEELGRKLTAWATAAVMATVVGFASFYLLTDSTPAPVITGTPVAGAVWRPFSPLVLEELKSKRVPVLVDFTARWCFTCQLNKKTSLHTEATENFMRAHGIVGLIADKTEDAPEIDQLMVELGQSSRLIPFYAVYPADGGPVITYNQGPLLQGKLLEMLEKASGRSATASTESTAMKPLAAGG